MAARRHRIRALVGVAVLVALAVSAVAALAAGPAVSVRPPGKSPLFGIEDDRIVTAADPAARVRLLGDAGAGFIRVALRWDQVAPIRPANPTSPDDPAYNWRQYDAIVDAAAANHVEVLFTVFGTPAWARDPSVPSEARWPDASIRPADPADFGRFGEAAARRYAPRGVHKWEGWNEPNIALYLRPQAARVGGKWVPVSPDTYSAMLRGFYAAVKAVDPTATVAGGVTAPAGDRFSQAPADVGPVRVPPDVFIAELGKAGRRPPMDVVSHHPYPLRAPIDTTPPSRTYVDLYNLSVLTRVIDRTYLRGRRLWLTEFGFGTRPVPEYTTYFSKSKQAAYIADAYRRMKANPRVALASYYFLQDHAGWASGVIDQAGRRKPGYQALALPFAARATTVRRGRVATLVGQARAAGAASTVLVQRTAGARWVTLRALRTARDGSFKVTLRPAAKLTLRARWSGITRTGARAANISPPVIIAVR